MTRDSALDPDVARRRAASRERRNTARRERAAIYRARRASFAARVSGARGLFSVRAVVTDDGLIHGPNFMEDIALPRCMRDTVMFVWPLAARDALVENLALTGTAEDLVWTCVYCIADSQRDPWPR